MNTKWINIEKEINMEIIKEAGDIIKQGGLVAFPTETVYGLGGDGLNPRSAKKIYTAKGRPSDNPLIIHLAKTEDLYQIAAKVPKQAEILAEKYWPGPLTMILPKNDRVPPETTGGLETVAVRIPAHEAARMFIAAAGGFVAAPSANTSGKPSPTVGKYVYEDMDGKIDMLLDGGQVGIGLESTIVDLTGEIPVLLRPGYITLEMLTEVLGEVRVAEDLPHNGAREPRGVVPEVPPKAPGMKYRHYAPKGELVIVDSFAATDKERRVTKAINEFIAEKQNQGYKTGVIAADESITGYIADVKKSVGKRADEEAIAHELFRILREFDEENVQYIYSEAFKDTGIGQAIMNRLLKAAEHKIIYI